QTNAPFGHRSPCLAALLDALLAVVQLLEATVVPQTVEPGIPPVAEEGSAGDLPGVVEMTVVLQAADNVADHRRIVRRQLDGPPQVRQRLVRRPVPQRE